MRRGGGLYSNFVSANDDGNRPYRGAEIPPPSSLTGTRGNSGLNKNYGGVPPPANFHSPGPSSGGVNKQGYSTMNSIQAGMINYSEESEFKVRKARTEDDYFNEDDETDYRIGSKPKIKDDPLPYQPAPGSPGPPESKKAKEDSDSEEDPLDAFMANLEKDAKKQGVKAIDTASTAPKVKDSKGFRQDIEDADDEESYYKWLEENPDAGRVQDEDELEIEYDEDGNPLVPNKPKHIDPLAALDHSQIEYKPFEKVFYTEHPDIAGLSPIQIIDLQHKLGVRVSGASPPKPVSSFGHFGFDEPLMKAIRKSEFAQPTPIQSQAIPALLSGRDCIGIAKTGSGKTASFLWPMLTHIMDQSRLLKGEGPIGNVKLFFQCCQVCSIDGALQNPGKFKR